MRRILVPILLALAAAASPAAAQPSGDDRFARCDNNRARIAALEALRGPYVWNDEQIARMRTQLVAIRRVATLDGTDGVSAGEYLDAVERVLEQARALAADIEPPLDPAVESIDDLIADFNARIDRAVREQPLNEVIRVALDAHRTNLAALRCDEPVSAAAGPATLYGRYQTDWGLMEIGPNGATYVYSGRNGRLDSLPAGYGTVSGIWRQDGGARDCGGGQYYGRYTITFTAQGFTGQFGYCDDPPALGWSGTRRR